MTQTITTTGRSIQTVTAEIVAISNQAAQMAYMSMVEIGRRLTEAKELVPHGEWGQYLKNEVQFSQRTANNFIQIFERSGGANSQTFANLGYSQIVRLLALPEEDVEELAQTHDVAAMSVRELDQIIRERDAARKAQEQAEAHAAETAEALEKSDAALRRIKDDLREMQTVADSAKTRATVAEQQAAAAQEATQKRFANLRKKLDAANAKVEQLRKDPQIPDALRQELADQADQAAREKYQAELDRAQREAEDARQALAQARSAGKLSDTNVMAFNLLCKQVVEDINRLAGYRIKVAQTDPAMAEKMGAYMVKLGEALRAKGAGQ